MLRKVLIVMTLAVLAAAPLSAQSLDDVLAKYIKARGGMEKLKAVKTMRITGKFSGGGNPEFPFVAEQKRPENLRLEFTYQGLTGVQAYDGKVGWAINPFQGKKDAELMGEDQLKPTQEQADFDGPLVDYKAKGHTVELLGKEQVEGTDAYKLKVTLKNGTEEIIYLDSEEYLEIKNETKHTVRGTESESVGVVGDYKEVEGLMFAFSQEGGPKGTPSSSWQKVTIEKVEFNIPIDDSRFAMPAPTAPPAAKPEEPKK